MRSTGTASWTQIFAEKITHVVCWLSQGAEIQVKVNKITSTRTQLPYEYYSLDYCKPKKIINSAENLGEVLRGDRIENSPYIVSSSYPLGAGYHFQGHDSATNCI